MLGGKRRAARRDDLPGSQCPKILTSWELNWNFRLTSTDPSRWDMPWARAGLMVYLARYRRTRKLSVVTPSGVQAAAAFRERLGGRAMG